MEFITDNILLIFCLIGSGILLAFPQLAKGKNAGLSPAETVIKVNDKNAQLVDVRTPKEFATGNLAGSVNIPTEDLISKLSSLDKNRPVILVCQNGRRAAQALKTLKGKGFSEIYTLEGGIVAWQAAKLPLSNLSINNKKTKRKH